MTKCAISHWTCRICSESKFPVVAIDKSDTFTFRRDTTGNLQALHNCTRIRRSAIICMNCGHSEDIKIEGTGSDYDPATYFLDKDLILWRWVNG